MNRIAQTDPTRTRSGLSQLDQLRQFTTIVADTSDFSLLKTYAPQDATTNPTLILKAAQQPEHQDLVERVVHHQRRAGAENALPKRVFEDLLVAFGCEILKVVPGRVSTETDASLSFDTEGLVRQGRRFIELYAAKDIPRERVLIKVASTWEGIRAAEILEREGIHCNLTLLFTLPQAVACAAAKVKLISPFVGRILDWYKAQTGHDYEAAEDPGVESVKEIYAYFKHFGYETEVMGASFRNKGEILELAGCDALTISPHLLGDLQAESEPVKQKLNPALARHWAGERLELDERKFRWLLNESAMATEKLAEGIRQFNADALKLEKFLSQRFGLGTQPGFPA